MTTRIIAYDDRGSNTYYIKGNAVYFDSKCTMQSNWSLDDLKGVCNYYVIDSCLQEDSRTILRNNLLKRAFKLGKVVS
jgi:hypothetical protein